MPKPRRKVEVDRDLLRRFLELLERSRETDRKVAETVAEGRILQEKLRQLYARR